MLPSTPLLVLSFLAATAYAMPVPGSETSLGSPAVGTPSTPLAPVSIPAVEHHTTTTLYRRAAEISEEMRDTMINAIEPIIAEMSRSKDTADNALSVELEKDLGRYRRAKVHSNEKERQQDWARLQRNIVKFVKGQRQYGNEWMGFQMSSNSPAAVAARKNPSSTQLEHDAEAEFVVEQLKKIKSAYAVKN